MVPLGICPEYKVVQLKDHRSKFQSCLALPKVAEEGDVFTNLDAVQERNFPQKTQKRYHVLLQQCRCLRALVFMRAWSLGCCPCSVLRNDSTLDKLVQPVWRTVWASLKKRKTELPYNPAIPLWDIYPEKTTIQKESCTPMFTAALFTIARSRKQPKCPSTDEWIKKMWCIYTMEYYSAIKKNEIMPFVATRVDLEIIILSKVSQTEKDKYMIFVWGIF